MRVNEALGGDVVGSVVVVQLSFDKHEGRIDLIHRERLLLLRIRKSECLSDCSSINEFKLSEAAGRFEDEVLNRHRMSLVFI